MINMAVKKYFFLEIVNIYLIKAIYAIARVMPKFYRIEIEKKNLMGYQLRHYPQLLKKRH